MTGKPTPITLDNDPLAPYLIAPGWRVGDLLFLSGQASIGPDGSIVGAGDIDAQIAQTFANIEVTIYLTDMGNFPKILEARKRWFTPPYPADTTVEVKGLALPELMVEIDVIASV